MKQFKKPSLLTIFLKGMGKGKRIFILAIVFVFLMASIAPAQEVEVIERYDLGNNVEDITYISTGELAGKCAFADGWNVYTLDLVTWDYEKLFYQGDLNLQYPARGIAYISLGDFAGNFLMNDGPNPDTLFIVSSSGDLVSEVKAVGFQWENWCESITEITSEAHTGCFAMMVDTGAVPHIVIFRIVKDGGSVNAYLENNIENKNNILDYSNGICFLPEDANNPYPNHFVLGYELKVIDFKGNLKETFDGEVSYEGLTYINQGKLIVADYWPEDTWLRTLDGSYKEELTQYVTIGFGISYRLNVNWLAGTNEFLVGRMVPPSRFMYCSRIAPGIWTKNAEIIYPTLQLVWQYDITQLTSDGKHYLLGQDCYKVGDEWLLEPIRGYMVQKLDSNLQWEETYPLYELYPGKNFSDICYTPGVTSAEDKFALVQNYDSTQGVREYNIYLFDNTFSYPAEVFDYRKKGIERIFAIYYDSKNTRYYVLDGWTMLRVFDTSWEEITEFDISYFVPGPNYFYDLTKITSGDLEGNLALVDREESEIVIVKLKPQIIISQLEKLTEEIQIGDFDNEIKNSLVKKLENAIKSIEKKNINAAINKIRAFQNQVKAQSGKKISFKIAEEWIAWAEDIIQDLENI